MERSRKRIAMALVVVATLVASALPAFADNAAADGDGVAPMEDDATLALGTVCANTPIISHPLVAVRRNGSAGGTNVFANGSTVTFSTGTITGAGLTGSVPAPNTITMPANWDAVANNTFSDAIPSTVTLNRSILGAFNGSVVFNAQGVNSDGNGITRSVTMSVTANVQTCAPADTTPPVLTVTPSAADGTNGWFITSPVTVAVQATDASGISDITCSPAFAQTGSSSTSRTGTVTVSAQGTTTVTCTAKDAATPVNTSAAVSATVKIDTTAPSAALSITAGNLGDNGWYTSDVTVETSGGDDVSGPVTCTAPQHQTDETTGTPFSGTCTNQAGLHATASSLVVKLDKTGPSAALAVTAGALGNNGWYTSDVTVSTIGDDDISFPVSCTGPQHLTTESPGTEFNGSCTNDAGLTTAAAPLTVKLDKTGPSAVLEVTAGEEGDNGWYVSDVTIETSGNDAAGPVTCTAPQHQTDETPGTEFDGSCTNEAGLSTDAAPLTVKLDKTGPSAALAVTAGDAGANGWYTSDVTVSTSGDDDISGPATCTNDQFQTDETPGTEFNGSCTNEAGLSTDAAPLTVKLDKTGPSAVLAVTAGDAGENGWYTSDVTVSASGDDDISGPVSCTDDQFQTDETEGTDFDGSCTNDAGLSTDAAPLTVKLDKTGPSAMLFVTTGDEGDNGWYTSDVTVSTTGADDISGPATCTDDQHQTDETAGTEFNGSCKNEAGLETDAASITVKLDKTGPSAALAVTAGDAGDNGWYTSNVTVSASGDDDISGPVICTDDQFQTDETPGTEFNGSCTNDAGLETDAAPLTVKLDTTAPSASLAVTAGTLGANGWYTSDVTVSTTGADSISGPVTCTDDQHLTSDSGGTEFDGSCTNDAGLSMDAAPLTVKLDKTNPSLTWNGGPADGGSYIFGSVPSAPTCTAADVMSGPNGCGVAGHGTGVGSHSMTATAHDQAGNAKQEVRNYSVGSWTLNGFYNPVNMNGILNTVKGGSTVPLKFNVYAGSTELTDISAIDTFTVAGMACPGASTVTDDIEFTTTGGTTLRYGDGQFIQNWQTPKKPGVCYKVTMRTDDGSSISALFKLK